LLYETGIHVARERKDFCLRAGALDPFGGLEPVHLRHGDIYDYNIGVQFFRLRDGILPVADVSDHIHIRLRGDKRL
jgi:hypothetical protein